jgi:hypothetical protein
MAIRRDNALGLELSSVPAINIRLEFNLLLALFRSRRFREQFSRVGRPRPIATAHSVWHGRPKVLLTSLLRESIVGLESAVSAAVLLEALLRGKATREVLEASKNPMSLGGPTAHCVFNSLPALVDISYSIKASDEALWERLRTFYTKVRNPLFHAYQIGKKDAEPVWRALEFLWEIFGWLNSWHPLDRLMPSTAMQWAPGTIEQAASIVEIAEESIENLLRHAEASA